MGVANEAETAVPSSESDTGGALRGYLAPLAELDDRPLTDHAERFGEVHAGLQAALAEIDAAG